ncbi:MAG: hypothetical protein GY951_03580 [Psychromonas sp.]|nr:hypothetical protein [Alteromonadales bacterium]MCP5077121.1 hypothetical protein [Psychromonas sp.]
MKKLMLLPVLLLLMISNATAYSYAAAGKEPVIDGREAILVAMQKGDFKQVDLELAKLNEELIYLKKEHDVDLIQPFKVALENRDKKQIEGLIDVALYEEIVRRLEGATTNLNDYQVAKVLVVKSKLFLDLLKPKLDSNNSEQANLAINGLLKSIGNPGVFGVGQEPADEKAFSKYQSQLLTALKQFQL